MKSKQLVMITVATVQDRKVIATATMSMEDLREELVGKALRYSPDVPAHLMQFSDDLDAAVARLNKKMVPEYLKHA